MANITIPEKQRRMKQKGATMANQVATNQNKGTAVSNANQFTKRVSEILDAILKKKVAALPKSLNTERFELNCVQMMQDAMKDYNTKEKWMKCDPTSVAMTLSKAAFLDLDFFNGEAYAIPYGTNVQFQTDYKGEVKLIKKYSRNPIRDVYAKLVREGDVFEVSIIDGVQHLTYKPDPFSKKDIIGAFAVIYYKDGSMIFDTMGVDEIEHIRQTYSKAAKSPAWQNSYGEMCKKTVLRRICKMVDLDFNVDQIRAFNEGGDSEFDKVKDAPPVQETRRVDIFENDPKMQAQIAQASAAQIEQKEASQMVENTQAAQNPEPVDAVSDQDAEFAAFEEAYSQNEAGMNEQGEVIDTDKFPFR